MNRHKNASQLIMVIELSGVQFGLKSYIDLKTQENTNDSFMSKDLPETKNEYCFQ
jgi:hypothetical protein